MPRLRPYALPLTVAALAAGGTFLVAVWPAMRFAYEAPDLRVSLETLAGLVALLAAYLVLGRYRRTHRLDQLLLTTALALLAVSTLVQAGQLATVGSRTVALLAVGGGLTGAILLAAAALAPAAPPRRSPVLTLGAALVLLAAVAGGIFGLTRSLPTDLSYFASRDASRPQFTSAASVLTIQITTVLAYFVASVGFARRAAATGDSFLAFLATAATLGAFARVNYLLFPPLQAGLVYTGDLLRVLFYLVLLVGAARELEGHWHGLADAAVLEERRRIARDLHDGVAQELAFIGRKARRSDDESSRQIAASADRALADSRRAIAALTRPIDEPLEEVLARAVGEVAARHGVDVDLRLARGIVVAPESRETLVRIACEAVSNAAQHAAARKIRVELTGGERAKIRIVDDGKGFDTGVAAPPGRFGLQGMRERAGAGGGSFSVSSAPGAGTVVEVELS